MKRVLFFTLFALIGAGTLFVSCINETTSPVAPQGEVLPLIPKGTIQGIMWDRCTFVPIAGARLSLAYNGTVQTVTSDAAGQFSFRDVPPTDYSVLNGSAVITGSYTITADLKNVNAGIADSNKKYRDYYYRPVTVTFTSLGNSDTVGVSGLAATVQFEISELNTTVNGTVVDDRFQPVPNAQVYLTNTIGGFTWVLFTTATDATGAFTIPRVDNGTAFDIVAKSADGTRSGMTPTPYQLACNNGTGELRPQVTVERIMLVPDDNTNPRVVGITPAHNSDVSISGLSFVYTFSEPIRQTPYTRVNLGLGHSTIVDDIIVNYVGMKKTAGPVTFTTSWNAAFTQLTIVPINLTGSGRYQISIATALPKLTDMTGLAAVNNTQITGDFETLNFTTAGNTPVPSKPALTRRFITGQFSALNYTGGTVGLAWSLDSNARSYNIYKKVGRGPFERYQTNLSGPIFSETVGFLVSPTPSPTTTPIRSEMVQYIVRAVSYDLVESVDSDIITVVDEVKPRLVTASVIADPSGVTNRWQYTIDLNEPMDFAKVGVSTNYSFSNTGAVSFSVQQAIPIGWNNGTGRYTVRVIVNTSAALPVGYILQVSTNVTDVSNNPMDTNLNGNTFTF